MTMTTNRLLPQWMGRVHVAHVSNVHDPNGSCMLLLSADYHVVPATHHHIKTINRGILSERMTPGMRFLALAFGWYIMCFTGLLCVCFAGDRRKSTRFWAPLTKVSQNLREHTSKSNFESIPRVNQTNLRESSTTGTSSNHS